MNRIQFLVISLALAGCMGCGQDPKPPAAAPPSPFKPAADVMTEKAANGQSADTALSAADDSAAENETAEVSAPSEEMADDSDASGPDDDSDDSEGTLAADDDEQPARAKSGKWMRGLSNSLNHAFSKSLDKAAQPKDAAKPPAPDDDPFPDGEPDDRKPEE